MEVEGSKKVQTPCNRAISTVVCRLPYRNMNEQLCTALWWKEFAFADSARCTTQRSRKT